MLEMKLAFLEHLVCVSLWLVLCNAFECTTPDNRKGDCKSFIECDSLLEILRNSYDDTEIRIYIKNSQCQWSPVALYCCPNETESNFKISKIGLPNDVCGHSLRENITTRIVEGEKAHIGEFPWLVLLKYEKQNEKFGFFCGGSLITNSHVLTSAHCVDSTNYPSEWKLTKIRLGEFDLSTQIDCEKIEENLVCGEAPREVDIEQIFTHEDYRPAAQGSPNDIAVIKLSEFVEFTDFIKPICLPTLSDEHGSVIVAGFGKTENQSHSKILLKAEIDIVERNECAKKYLPQGRVIRETQICAAKNNADACNGDSGNALIKQDSITKAWHQVGIVSFGSKKCGRGFPGIYISVIKFIDWIKIIIEK